MSCFVMIVLRIYIYDYYVSALLTSFLCDPSSTKCINIYANFALYIASIHKKRKLTQTVLLAIKLYKKLHKKLALLMA